MRIILKPSFHFLGSFHSRETATKLVSRQPGSVLCRETASNTCSFSNEKPAGSSVCGRPDSLVAFGFRPGSDLCSKAASELLKLESDFSELTKWSGLDLGCTPDCSFENVTEKVKMSVLLDLSKMG